MAEPRISVTVARNSRPKPEKAAAALLERCREFWRDPENEKAYQDWKKEKKIR